MSSPQTILGIDPGLASLGWGLIVRDKGVLTCITYGTVRTEASTPLPQRLLDIYEEVVGLIENFSPKVLAVEKLFFGKNAKTAMAVGESRGVIILSAAARKVTILEYSPAEIKIALTGYGNAEKLQVQIMVQKTLNLPQIPEPNHAADALAVAITAAVSNNLLR